MNSLETFRYTLKGLSKPNRFLCFIYLPSYLTDNFGESIKFYVKGAQIPQRSFNDIEIKYFGQTLRIPGDNIIDDLILTFINTDYFKIRTLFERWMHELNQFDNGYKKEAKEGIEESIIHIKQIGKNFDDILAEYVFYNCYPKNISTIELSQDSNDMIEDFTVTFSYSYFNRFDKKWLDNSKYSENSEEF